MKRFLRVIVIIFGIIAITLLAIFLTHPAKAQFAAYLEKHIYDQYGVKVRIGRLDYEFRPLTLIGHDVKIFGGQKGESTFFDSRILKIELPYSSLWSDRFHVRKIEIESPSVFPENLPKLSQNQTGQGTFQVDEITIKNGAAQYQQYNIKNIQCRLAASSSEIKIEMFRAEYSNTVLSVTGSVKNQERPKYEFHYDMDGDASLLRQLKNSAPDLSGPVHSSGRITGAGRDYEAEGFLEAKALRIKDSHPFYLGGKYSLRSAPTAFIDLTFKDVPSLPLLDQFPGIPRFATNISGNLRYSGWENPWKSDSTFWLNLEPAKSDPSLEGELDGSIHNGVLLLDASDLRSGKMSANMSGQFTPHSMKVQVSATIPSTHDLKPISPDLATIPGAYRLEAELQGTYEDIRASAAITATHPEFSGVVNGAYWFASQKINAQVQGNAQAAYFNPDISGPVNFEATVSGSASKPLFKASVRSMELQAFEIPVGDLSADINSDGKIVRFAAFLPKYSGAFEGEYGIAKKEFQLNGNFKDVGLQQLHSFLPEPVQDASGMISANIEVSGRLPQWKNSTATLTFQQAQFEKNGISVAVDPDSSLRLEHQEIHANIKINSAEGEASIVGSVPIDQTRAINLKASGRANLALTRLFTNVLEAKGTIGFEIAAGGKIHAPVLSGEAVSENLELKWPQQNLDLQNATFDAKFSGQTIAAHGTGDLKVSRPDVTGDAKLEFSAAGKGTALEAWTGNATLSTDNLGIEDTKFSTQSPVEISLANGIVELKPVKIRAGDLLDLSASGKWNLKNKAIDSEIKTTADLSLISKFYPELRAAGDLQATARIEGTSDAPRFAGAIQLEKGMMRIEGYPMVLENIHMIAPLQEDGLRIDSMTANLGGGDVQAAGHIFWNQKLENAIDVRISAKRVAMNYPEGLRSILNGDLSFQGSEKRYTLAGKVDVARSMYRDDIDPRGRLIHTLTAHKKELLPETDSISNRIYLQLDVQTLRDAVMDNNIGRLRAAGKLSISGTLAQPLLTGRARIKEGSYLDFENRTYTVEEATLDYRNSEMLNPEVRIRITTEVEYQEEENRESCAVELVVTGSMTDPSVEPHSSCSDLSSYQIYSLLLTGTTTLTEGSQAFFTEQLAAYLSGSVLYDFQKSISHGLGLSTFALQPLIIASESNPGARLTLGKRLSRDLDLAYSLSLTETTDQLWLANYRIRNNFNLRLVEQENTFTTSLRHRFHFGGAAKETATPLARGRSQVIGSVVYQNDTGLPEKTLNDRIAKPGDRYSYWRIQNGIDEIKTELQKSGYLFPSIEVEETNETESTINLRIRVSGQGKRDFVIFGTEVDSSKMAEYRQWWRETFSEASALAQMEDDLEQNLYEKGFLNATVTESTEDQAGKKIYRFTVNPGLKWENASLILAGQNALPQKEFQEELRSLYVSRNEMISEAIHRFPQLSKKITALYAEQGFLKTRVRPGKIKYNPETKSVEVQALIDEGPRSMVAALTISDDQTFPQDLISELHLEPGTVYLPLEIYNDQRTVLQYYKTNGYWNTRADVHAEPEKNTTNVVIAYEFYAGTRAKVHSVEIRGTVRTREGIIRKELNLQPGEELTDQLLAQAQERLYALRVFDSVSIHLEQANEPQMFDVIVELVENKRFAVTYGGRYDTEEDFEGEAQLEDQNFLGTAQSVFAYGRLNNNEKRYQLGFNSPSIFGWHWNSFFFAERVNQTDLGLIQTNFNFQQQTHLGNSIVLQSGYRFTKNKTTLEIPDEAPQEFVIKISRLQSAVFADYRDNPIDARHGFFASTALEYAPEFLGSDITFLKSYSQFYIYYPVSQLTIASAVRVGLATTFQQEFLISSERFFAGGSDTLRGFRFQEVGPIDEIFNEPAGGKAVLVLNEELRFPVYRWFGGVVFYDVGNVYESVSDFGSDLRHSAGFGTRVALPYGILGRFDVGFNLSPRNDEPRSVFHFSIGQAF